MTAFPKDLMIAVFGLPPGFETWQWAPRRAKATKKSHKQRELLGGAR